MPTEFIPNVGNIELPDDLTDKEKEDAVNSHPLVQKYLQNQGKDESLYSKLDKYLTNTFGPINNYIRNSPTLNAADQLENEVGKGVPILGQLAADRPGEADFETQHPYISGAARTAGAIGSTIPASMLAGPGALAQGVLFGGLGTTDQAAKNYKEGGIDKVINESPKDYAKTFGIDALFGAGGSLLGKVISPNAVKPPDEFSMPPWKPTPSNFTIDSQGTWIKKPSLFEPNPETSDVIQNAINNARVAEHQEAVQNVKNATKLSPDKADAVSALGGAAFGYMTGGIENAVLGAILGPYARHALEDYAPKAINAYRGNQLMADPSYQAILNSLTGETGNTYTNQ